MKIVLGSFDDYSAAYQSLLKLKEIGLTTDNMSLVGQYLGEGNIEYGEEFNVITNTKEDLVKGVRPDEGQFGELSDLINQGTIMNAPDLESTIVFGALTNEVEGASSKRILGALVEHGVNRSIAEKIEAELKSGKTIVTVEDENLKQAAEILKIQGASLSIY